jgi:hypothetical protein
LTATLVAELGLQSTLGGSALQMRALLPTATYAMLAPVAGCERAAAFILGKLEAESALWH